jgi:hypothetical protein
MALLSNANASSLWVIRVGVLMRSLVFRLLALMSTGLPAGPKRSGQEEANREAVTLAEGVQPTKGSLIRGCPRAHATASP